VHSFALACWNNKNYNVAGGVINYAARVMGLADRGQILFTKEAHHQIIDMVDDPNMVDRFHEFDSVGIKHGVEIEVYQYLGENDPYINTAPPEDIVLMKKTESAISKLSSLTSASSFPFSNLTEGMKNLDADSILQTMENMGNAMAAFQREMEAKPVIDVKKEDE
jgi:hypothetical protein